MLLNKKVSVVESAGKLLSRKVLPLSVKVVDRYASDKLLLLSMNVLDKRVPTEMKSLVIDGIDTFVPHTLRSFAIIAADEYVPDAVANSRKICAVLAGVGKYVPDRIIPSESIENWWSLKEKFHIPRLLSSRRT